MTPRPATSRGTRRSRSGVTMIEMMVALVIIGVGLLALAGSATLVTRLMGGGTRQALAATLAQSRLEQLRATSCATLASGTDTTRSIVTKWTVTTITRGRDVTLTVKYPMARGPRIQSFRTVVPCG
jgi:prepilin-type N-terminal cleavage/methylation domain-containing protein